MQWVWNRSPLGYNTNAVGTESVTPGLPRMYFHLRCCGSVCDVSWWYSLVWFPGLVCSLSVIVTFPGYTHRRLTLGILHDCTCWDKMRCMPSILPLFCYTFIKFNNTRARMLDYIYHTTIRLLWSLISSIKTLYFCHYVATLLWTSKRYPTTCKPLVVYRLYCMTLFHSQTRHHMINICSQWC